MSIEFSSQSGHSARVKLGFGAAEVELGSHICLLYRSEEERNQIVIPFIAQGINDSASCKYVVEEPLSGQLRDGLRSNGLSVEMAETSGQLSIFDPQTIYYPTGQFNVEETLSRLQSMARETLAAGYTHLRGTSDLSFIWNEGKGFEDYLAYEATINYLLPNYPVIILCQYDVTRFSGDMVLGVLQTHPYVIISGVLVRNPYFINPEQWLHEHRERKQNSLTLH